MMMMLFLIRHGAFLHWQSAGSRLFMKRESAKASMDFGGIQ